MVDGDGEDGFLARMKALGVLRRQQLSGRPSDRHLARRARVSQTTVGVWLRGERFPQDVDTFLVVVRELLDTARALGAATPGVEERLAEQGWRQAHAAEAARRAGVVSDGVVRAQGRAALETALAGAGATGAALPAALASVTPSVTPSVPGARRVEDWHPRLLGVKPSVTAPGGDDLPGYVVRDHDRELRSALRTMATSGGGVLLLIGNPSTGKTRSAYEAVRAELPGRWLVRPKDAAEVAALAERGGTPPDPAPLILWLDGVDRLLDAPLADAPLADAPAPLAAALVELCDPQRPTVVIGTLWPEQYDRHASASVAAVREVLDLATTVVVPDEFSASERERTQDVGWRDPRLSAAYWISNFGIVQTLAGAPALERCWRTGDPYGRAVLTAAVDARRLGGPEVTPSAFLRAAAPGYLTSAQWARADDGWWERAIGYATRPVEGTARANGTAGTTSALSPCAGDEPGSVVGYAVADYLLHLGRSQRLFEAVPERTWRTFLTTTDDPRVLVRIGWSAQWRLLYELAEELYLAAGTEGVLPRAKLLVARGRSAEAWRLVTSLAERGHDEAVQLLVTWVRSISDDDQRLAQLARYAPAHDEAARALARELAAIGRHGDAVEQWTGLAEKGDGKSAVRAAELLAEAGRGADALELLRRHAPTSPPVRRTLFDLLLKTGAPEDTAEAEQLLRRDVARSSTDGLTEFDLVEFLRTFDRLEELESLATAGSRAARSRMIDTWATEGEHDPAVVDRAVVICARWDAESDDGPWSALHLLRETDRLAQAVDVVNAWERDHEGNDDINAVVTDMLMDLGRWDDVAARADRGDTRAQEAVARRLLEQGRIDEVMRRAERGELPACRRVSELLAERGDFAGAAEVWCGTVALRREYAHLGLVDLLHEHDRVDDLLDLLTSLDRRLGKREARILADLLVRKGRIAELTDRAAAGDKHADEALVHHLASHRRFADVRSRAVAGSGAATRVLLDLGVEEPELQGLTTYGLRLDGSIAVPRAGVDDVSR
ncbi:hypothetical protein ACH4E8_16225 [Streptomyces sp. NPDC017979]|uniref:hypothetical protein n=1 Tax=Streptomyces sp. NPDC017979 TaxID=3365024 RepID=UPI003798EC91